ncbi:hypothetical protein SCUP515_03700 [Seiridium cupressi]
MDSHEDHEAERAPLVASDRILELDEYRDGVLPYQDNPGRKGAADLRKWWTLNKFRREQLLVLTQIVFGIFLATCPIPRFYLANPLRTILITFDAALVTFATSRRVVLNDKGRLRRILVAWLGFSLSMYAIFGASDEVHIDLRWRSLLWYQTYEGLRLGYLSRWVLILVGYAVQKSAGLHSRNRILGSYLLSLLWVYADMPTTIFDHARGREYW